MKLFTTAVICCIASSFWPTPAAAQKCEGAELAAFGKHYSCVMTAQAKAVKKTGKIASPGEPKCGDTLTAKWAKAGEFGDCTSVITSANALQASTDETAALTEFLAPGAPAASICTSIKLGAAGKYAACRLKVERSNLLSGKPLDFAKCDAKLGAAFAKAEGLAVADCLTLGDAGTAHDEVRDDANYFAGLAAGSATTTTTTSTTTSTTVPLDDGFDGVALDPSWSVLHAPVATLTVSGGQLHVEIDSQSNWFNNLESVLIYKQVTGDFDVHTTAYAAKTSNLAAQPDPQFRLGGLLARDPASTPAASNFVHVALGAGSMAVPVASEDKTTTNSASTYTFHPIAATEGELRLTRVGNDFSMYYRPVGDPTWQLLGTHTRADLPATLQVGLMAYDNNASFDLTVSFDEIVFD